RLVRQPAARVGALVQSFYASRYSPDEPATENQVRITWDDNTNTVFVQAAPADLAEIRDLIWRLDNLVSAATNDIRIVPLRNGLADDISNLLLRAISQGAVPGGVTGGLTGGALGAAGGLTGVRPGGITGGVTGGITGGALGGALGGATGGIAGGALGGA